MFERGVMGCRLPLRGREVAAGSCDMPASRDGDAPCDVDLNQTC